THQRKLTLFTIPCPIPKSFLTLVQQKKKILNYIQPVANRVKLFIEELVWMVNPSYTLTTTLFLNTSSLNRPLQTLSKRPWLQKSCSFPQAS
uniref:Uncharacterized protein n=1 Tax=Bubo bubo TaxID=30461 RepID=A0A8C0IE97_BUBBB